jgi:hypothetical protein
MLKQWLKDMGVRAGTIRMMHVALNNDFWYPVDIWFVLTGRA